MSWKAFPKYNTLRRSQWLLISAAAVLCLIIPFLFLSSTPFQRLHSWIYKTTNSTQRPALPEQPPEEPSDPGFYNWTTRSAFRPLDPDHVANTSIQDLCAYFPTHLLNDIQPILKTGHGVLEARVRPQLQSVSACLSDHLLIFSDVDEVFEGHDIIDVVADIPKDLRESEPQLEPYQNGSLTALNPERKFGWRTDKFKFLPAVSRAWRMRPQRRWYVFYEADTYIVWDNVFRLLENFDPDTPHYFGSPSPGVEGTWFANGGPGFILSREAMRRLTEDDWDAVTGEYLGSKLNERQWEEMVGNCCGDSSLGWALYGLGVPLEGLWPMFNPHPPHGVPFSDMYWCQPILTMHKPMAEDMASLWRWQWEHRQMKRPLLYRDLAILYLNLTTLTTKQDWDNSLWDGFRPDELPNRYYTHDPHASFSACGQACKYHSGCFQWTYHARKCTFVRSFRLGKAREPEGEGGMEERGFEAGWVTDKIQRWIERRPCERVEWVRPSVKRIF